MRAPMKISFLAALLLFLPVCTANAFIQTKFASEDEAHLHCRADVVVWLVLPGNGFVRKGDPRYGATRQGTYICEHDAIADGGRAAH